MKVARGQLRRRIHSIVFAGADLGGVETRRAARTFPDGAAAVIRPCPATVRSRELAPGALPSQQAEKDRLQHVFRVHGVSRDPIGRLIDLPVMLDEQPLHRLRSGGDRFLPHGCLQAILPDSVVIHRNGPAARLLQGTRYHGARRARRAQPRPRTFRDFGPQAASGMSGGCSMKTSVGMIGLGLMGKPMSVNILGSGFPLVLWNRTRSKAEALAGKGARLAATPREAAEGSDVLLTIVSDPPALEEVAFGKDGLIRGLRSGSVLVDSSTVSPALARRLAAACAERGAEFLDAPVTGGTWGAEKGDLVFMVGGKKEVLERVEPVLSAMGKRFFHLGPHGAGQTTKLAMNLILALQVDALAEAVALVRGAGLRAEGLIEVLQSSMAR